MECENASGFNESGWSIRTNLEGHVFGAVLMVICMLTLVGNGLVIVALTKSWHNTVSKPGNYLVFHLALTDVLNGLLTMPLGCVSLFTRDWIFGDTMCKVSGFLLVFFTTTSNVFLSMISLNRYHRLRNPSVRGLALRRRAFYMTMFCWTSGLVAALATASGWGQIVFVPGFDVNCMIIWDNSVKGIINMVFICSLLFVVPFSVMAITYAQIFALVRNWTSKVEPTRHLATITRAEFILDTVNSPENRRRFTLNAIQHIVTKRAEMKTAVTLSMVLGIFAVCWIPVMVVHAIRTFHSESVPATLQSLAILLMYLSPVCNPVIYSLRNSSFRAEIEDLLRHPPLQTIKNSSRSNTG